MLRDHGVWSVVCRDQGVWPQVKHYVFNERGINVFYPSPGVDVYNNLFPPATAGPPLRLAEAGAWPGVVASRCELRCLAVAP